MGVNLFLNLLSGCFFPGAEVSLEIKDKEGESKTIMATLLPESDSRNKCGEDNTRDHYVAAWDYMNKELYCFEKISSEE